MARLPDSRDDFIALIAAASESTGFPLEFAPSARSWRSCTRRMTSALASRGPEPS